MVGLESIPDAGPALVYEGDRWVPFESSPILVRMQQFDCANPVEAAATIQKIVDDAPGDVVLFERQPWTLAPGGRVWGRFGFVVFT